MFFEQSKLEPFISPARFFTTILPGECEARADEISRWQGAAAPGLSRLDAHLSAREFVLEAGYSIADIAVFGYVHVLDEAGLPKAAYPHVSRWIDDVRSTPGFRPLSELGADRSVAA